MTSGRYTVNDVMTKTVVTITPDAEFKEIAAAMEQWKVTAVPVVEGEGRVVGVVSEADLLTKEEFHDQTPGMIEDMHRLGDIAKAGSVRAKDLMTSPAITVNPDAPSRRPPGSWPTGMSSAYRSLTPMAASRASSAAPISSRFSCAPTTSSPPKFVVRSSTGYSPSRTTT